MMQVGTNQSATYHSQPSLGTSSGQAGRSSSTTRQQQSQFDNEQLANIRPRLCLLRKWPHYDGYGVHLARNQHWLGLRIGDVEPNSPAESGGLLREDVVLAVNGRSVENDDFFVILSYIQHELEDDHIRFLVLDPHSADLARRHNLHIDENYRTCVRMETPTLTVSPEKLLYDQWRNANNVDPTAAQNIIHLGPTLPINHNQPSSSNQPYEEKAPNEGPDVYTFLPYSDTNNNLRPEPRLCSVTLRPGMDIIGISLQPDKDFGHIIKQVEPNSLADRAGIEADDCIVALNGTPLLNVPYEDVLSTLRKSRNESDLDFLVAKKSYLLKSKSKPVPSAHTQPDLSEKYTDNVPTTTAEVLPSSNISGRDAPSSSGAAEALEQLYNKYSNEKQSSLMDPNLSNRPKETVSTTTNGQYNRVSPYSDDNQYSSKPQQGQILHGVGPATADRSSWGVSSDKSTDLPASIGGDSSVRSKARDGRPDADDTKGRTSGLEDAFKPLQVGITNQTSSQHSGNISPTSQSNRPSRPTSSVEQRDISPKRLPTSETTPTSARDDTISSRQNQPISGLAPVVPIVPSGPLSTVPDTETTSPQTTPSNQYDAHLATMPLPELKSLGYEFHSIQLMQPTETSPVGLKLTKQQEPLQYIITAVAKGTKADLAGLKVNDWLIMIEDNDIRTVEFSEVSREIRELLTNAGFINMLVARKKTATSTPPLQQNDKDKGVVPSSSSRPDSLGRQQGGQIPTSLLTTDITRDTPDNTQVRFVPDRSVSPPAVRSQRSPASDHESNANAPGGPYSVGLTNRISDESLTRSPHSQSRSPSHSPTREYTVNSQEKKGLSESEDYDEKEIRTIVLKEALGLDFNSFIPEGDSQTQTHFISNVQPSSMADRAGLRDGDRILTVNGYDVTNSIHEDVRRMMQNKRPLTLTVVNDPKYVDLIKSVKRQDAKPEDSTGRARSPVKPTSSDSNSDLKLSQSRSESPKLAATDELSKYSRVLFTDAKGPVKVKHCILRKEPTYNGYGLVLRYQSGLHLIDQVEENSPAYNAGLREDDIILYVDKKNVEQFTHDDVKMLIRKLSLSNTDIDLILMKKPDVSRYKSYEQKNTINWKPILEDKFDNETAQTVPPTSSNVRASFDQENSQRKSTSSSSKAVPPSASGSSVNQSPAKTANRTCILYPSAERTAGFALSGKTSPPYVICLVEAGSPAEKAGLRINDALLSINGKSVTETTYDETVKLIKEGLQKKSVELVVRDRSSVPEDNTNSQERTKFSLGSNDSGNSGNRDSIGAEPSRQGANAVEEYQKQRNKELSYSLRICHLHPTNADGTPAATFGFELFDDDEFEYPIISQVESQSPAERAGLQARDILLKINERKTKGLGYEKVRKEIEKARRDGRLEMLVADQETYDYSQRTKKPLKEPEMKVKHVFPKSRSSASFHKLPIAAMTSTSSMSTKDSAEQLSNSNTKSDDSIALHNPLSIPSHLSTPKETDSENDGDDDDDDEKQNTTERKSSPTGTAQAKTARNTHPTVSFDLSPPTSTVTTAPTRSHETPLKFFDRAQTNTEQRPTSSTIGQLAPDTSRSATTLNQTPPKEQKPSKAKSIPHAINNLFHRIGHSKSSKLDYDSPPKTKVSSKPRAPSPPTVRVGNNRLEESRVSQSLDATDTNATTTPAPAINDTVRSTISTGSFDYLRGPRRCVLKVDRNKGLGFVLSATGDYDHTITAVEKYSAADIAGLQINDEVLEVDGVDVRNVKYEQVVEMLVSAMRVNDNIEMRVIDGASRDAYLSNIDAEKQTDHNNMLNSNNNNNNNNNTTIPTTNHSQHVGGVSGDDLSDINSSISPFDSLNQQKIATSYPNLPGQLKGLDHVTNRALSGSVPALATGITASPNSIHLIKNTSISSEKGSITKLSDISTHDAPVARLCRVRKFATSPFYGFFLCGDPKKMGRVFISDVTKHSPAAVCGLRDGDRIIEINGSAIEGLTYETILNKIKHHMGRDDLELLVLDKKSVQWYRERNYPITSRTLPTIVHIEPIINDSTSETQPSEIPATHTKLVGFADRRVSKTGL